MSSLDGRAEDLEIPDVFSCFCGDVQDDVVDDEINGVGIRNVDVCGQVDVVSSQGPELCSGGDGWYLYRRECVFEGGEDCDFEWDRFFDDSEEVDADNPGHRAGQQPREVSFHDDFVVCGVTPVRSAGDCSTGDVYLRDLVSLRVRGGDLEVAEVHFKGVRVVDLEVVAEDDFFWVDLDDVDADRGLREFQHLDVGEDECSRDDVDEEECCEDDDDDCFSHGSR